MVDPIGSLRSKGIMEGVIVIEINLFSIGPVASGFSNSLTVEAHFFTNAAEPAIPSGGLLNGEVIPTRSETDKNYTTPPVSQSLCLR